MDCKKHFTNIKNIKDYYTAKRDYTLFLLLLTLIFDQLLVLLRCILIQKANTQL